ncbi:Integral membrane protein SED5 [Nakaseomyces bracarensis]|uniref:Integral membrane protein SED5 n=1 Tax=Nakaseomyces bracarensis TaxID=273131 RepID=A0ABR4NMG4_9SACH
MNIKNRTFEFQQSVATYRKRNRQAQHNEKEDNRNVSEFQKRASAIAREISSSAQLLSKLALLAKRKPMLNDNPVEIAELSFLIKRKIYAIEQSLVDLSKLQRQQKNGLGAGADSSPEVATQHSKNVVNLLNTKMRNISGGFKDVLEERQKMEMANRDRWEKISSNTGRSASNGVTATNSNANEGDANTNLLAAETATYNNSNPFMSSSVVEDEINASSANKGSELALPQSDSQMLLMMEEGQANNVYLQERNNAVEMIDSTIQEVGNLFQQLASMVQEQGEVIQRIDANVDEVDINITGAQRELLKYFDRVKSNRWLVAKVFFIIFCFFLVWVLVN